MEEGRGKSERRGKGRMKREKGNKGGLTEKRRGREEGEERKRKKGEEVKMNVWKSCPRVDLVVSSRPVVRHFSIISPFFSFILFSGL